MSELIQNQLYDYSNETIDKSLLGIVTIHNGLIVSENCRTIFRKDYRSMKGKVKIISGSKVEKELACTKFVGPGMLTAAILGNTIAAPPVDNILKVIEEIGFDRSSGVLLIVQNYAEYPINFTLAKLYAEAKGYNVKLILINNNCVLQNFKNATEEQGFLPMLYIHKIAGAMSEEGKGIDEIYSFCNGIINSGEIALLKAEYTNAIHSKYETEVFMNLAEQTFKSLINLLNTSSQNQSDKNLYERKVFHTGHEVAIMINSFGCNQIETNAFVLEVLKQIEICSLKVKRIFVDTFLKNSDITGFHICLLNLSFTPILIKYLDFPTSAPGWPKTLTSDMIGIKKDDQVKLIIPEKSYENYNTLDVNLQGPTMSPESSHTFLFVISMACKAIIACTKQLNTIDEKFGNGDYGTSLACGAKAIEIAIQEDKVLGTNPFVTFLQISRIIERTVGGLHGGLYSLFLRTIAEDFLKYQSDEQITAKTWLSALITANRAIKQLEMPALSDQTLLHVLVAIQIDLTNALNRNINPIDAFGIAVRTAENFSTNCKFKHPDPEAHAVGIWMRATYEGIKLKFTHPMSESLSI